MEAHCIELLLLHPFVFVVGKIRGKGRSLKVFNFLTGDLIRHFASCKYLHMKHLSFNGHFISISNDKVIVFDKDELTNKNIENEDLWRKQFDTVSRNVFPLYIFGISTASKLIVFRGNEGAVYDFWKDKDISDAKELSSSEFDIEEGSQSHDGFYEDSDV